MIKLKKLLKEGAIAFRGPSLYYSEVRKINRLKLANNELSLLKSLLTKYFNSVKIEFFNKNVIANINKTVISFVSRYLDNGITVDYGLDIFKGQYKTGEIRYFSFGQKKSWGRKTKAGILGPTNHIDITGFYDDNKRLAVSVPIKEEDLKVLSQFIKELNIGKLK